MAGSAEDVQFVGRKEVILMYKHFFKRLLDFLVALVAIICLSPLFLVVTLWLMIANKGAGAFFLQPRPGKDAKIFKVIKYKTMTDEKDADGQQYARRLDVVQSCAEQQMVNMLFV